MSTDALNQLEAKYGQEFELVASPEEVYPWGIGQFAEPVLRARPIGGDPVLSQFEFRLSDWDPDVSPATFTLRDDYLGVLMAPAYQALVEERLAGQLDQFRVIVWLADVLTLPVDITPEDFMQPANDPNGCNAKGAGVLIGVAVPEGTTVADLYETLRAVQERLGELPSVCYINLRIQGFTEGPEYETRVVNAETGEWAQALANSHTFGDGGILALSS